MAPKKLSELERKRAIRHLRQLIDALDTRVPHIHRIGESQIVSDAAALRAKALKRIADLES